MFRGKTLHLALSLVFYSSVTVFGQWSAADSGTTNNLNGGYLLDSGVGFVVGDAGTIVKTVDAGVTWSPLRSGTTNTLQDVYFFDATQGVAVGEQGLILRTTDGGAGWQGVTSGVKDNLRSVSFGGVNGISGGDSQTILYSTDAGASWHVSQSGFHQTPFLKPRRCFGRRKAQLAPPSVLAPSSDWKIEFCPATKPTVALSICAPGKPPPKKE